MKFVIMPPKLPAKRRGRPPKSNAAPEPPKSRNLKRIRKSPVATAGQGKRSKFVSLPSGSSRRDPSPQNTDSWQRCTCDGCEWRFFSGIRYKCAVCDDYDLCSACYNRKVHDLTHPFMQITKPGSQPTYLSPRCCNEASSSTTAKPATPTTPPFFYNTMSTAELKTFLTERGVEFGDVLGTETLCRRAWDTYCDCMTLAELNAFLLDRSISTVGCRDVNSRRQKAKDAFEPPTTRSRLPNTSVRKHDTVVLTGLKRGEMNGKTAMVISIIHAEGKALVEVLDQIFKVKLENLKVQDDIEELE